MRNRCLPLLALAASLLSAPGAPADEAAAPAKLRVVATLPHLAAHAREVGGDRVEVVALARGDQDPHYVQPTPSLMVEANRADLYVEVGLELELWSEHVLDGARNAKIRVTGPGHVFASAGVPLMGVPVSLTRAQGDIHPYGNPHIWLSPLNGVIEARNIEAGLERVDPGSAEYYRKRLADYESRIVRAYFGDELVKLLGEETLEKLGLEGRALDFLARKKFKGEPLAARAGGWLGKIGPYRGTKLVAYHVEWTYFSRDFGLPVEMFIEPKPGIPPTPQHLLEVKDYVRREGVPAIIYSPYFSVSNFDVLGKETGAKIVLLPTEVGGVPEAKDYFSLFDAITDRLAAALARRP
jgi:ABC-type Zn uptake system ZnuABC Zn-binding protein ZnuA